MYMEVQFIVCYSGKFSILKLFLFQKQNGKLIREPIIIKTTILQHYFNAKFQ